MQPFFIMTTRNITVFGWSVTACESEVAPFCVKSLFKCLQCHVCVDMPDIVYTIVMYLIPTACTCGDSVHVATCLNLAVHCLHVSEACVF